MPSGIGNPGEGGEMNNNDLRAFVLLLVTATVSAIAAILLMVGCMTSPDRELYSCDECYAAADILYRLKSASDKSVAAPLVEACRDALKERRAIERLEYCRQHTPAGMTESECRMWLNQK